MASKYIQKFPIPGSFPELVHDFTREVLREQPENIYEFGAQYFAAMDEGREFYYSQDGAAQGRHQVDEEQKMPSDSH